MVAMIGTTGSPEVGARQVRATRASAIRRLWLVRSLVAIRVPLLILGLVAAACGGDSASDTTTVAPPPPLPTAAPTAAPTSAPAPTVPATAAPAAVTEPPVVVGPFEITTADGLILEAERFGTGEDFVVLAHMRPADMSSWVSFAGLLGGEGYSVITFNFRGYGNSEGSGFAVDVDVVAAIDAAFELGARSVSVIGASMGGTGAIAAAAQRELAGVITLSAPAQFQDTDALAAAPDIATGLLLIAAQNDSPYNEHAGLIRDQVGGFAAVVTLPGRSHGTDMFQDNSEELTQTILIWLANQPRI
jgi:alpha/beta superfamily hydrolase